MIKGFNSKSKKRDDYLVLFLIIFSVILTIWLILPPRDKIAQIGYVCNNIKYSLNKETRSKYEEVLYYRNQGVYYARMNKEKAAL